jgi:hypothetical protein
MSNFINVSSPSNFVKLYISNAAITSNTGTGVLLVPSLQDITVNNNNGTFRWKQLDTTSQKVVATPSTNSLTMNIVLDDDAFYGTVGSTGTTATELGIFNISNAKTNLYFKMYWAGAGVGGTDKYITGNGYVTGLAPKVNPDQPVWITPFTIEVNGDFTSGAD